MQPGPEGRSGAFFSGVRGSRSRTPRFVKTSGRARSLDEASLARAPQLPGLKDYVTNIPTNIMKVSWCRQPGDAERVPDGLTWVKRGLLFGPLRSSLPEGAEQRAVDLLALAMHDDFSCLGTNFMDAADPGWELPSPHLGPVLDAYEPVKRKNTRSSRVHVLRLERFV